MGKKQVFVFWTIQVLYLFLHGIGLATGIFVLVYTLHAALPDRQTENIIQWAGVLLMYYAVYEIVSKAQEIFQQQIDSEGTQE